MYINKLLTKKIARQISNRIKLSRNKGTKAIDEQ